VRVVLLGPPGAGKGTQAARLAERYGAAHISTGDIFRQHAARGTELGRLARGYMEAGELVPDDVVVGMVTQSLDEHPEGFVLDGFPRTVPQAEALDEALAERGTPLTTVLAIVVPDDLAVRRIAGRRTCASCGRPVAADAEASSDRCPACGGELAQRPDDEESVVRTRLGVYKEHAEPLMAFYAARGLLRRIDGDAPADDVTARAEAVLGESVSAPGTSS
jgi:adenylate kinase